jgi:hypothetical protein
MKKDISNLILAVRNTLKDFSSGSITVEQAREKYNTLETRYASLRDRIEPGSNAGSLDSLCYHHNIENYSILSAVVSVTPEEVTTLLCYGSKSLMPKISDLLKAHVQTGFHKEISTIPPDPASGITHTIHCSLLKTSGEEKILFVSLSSSSYFSESSFIYTASVLKKILFGQSLFISSFSHFENVEKSIKDFTSLNCDREHDVIAHIFTFPRIMQAFSHRGTAVMFEVSRAIIGTLGDVARARSECFVLSIKDYLLLVRHRKSDHLTALPQKPVFTYNGIVIPHAYQEYRVENEASLYALWPDALTETAASKRGWDK